MRTITLSLSNIWQKINSSDVYFSLLLGIFVLSLRFLPFLYGQSVLFGDNYFLMVPGKLFTISWLSRGIFPLWNPYLFAGISWIGDINQSLLHPSTLLFLLFSPAVALNLTIFLQLLVSFVAMYFLARQFVTLKWAAVLAAVLWTFSPQLTGSLNNIATLQSMSLMPLVVLLGLQISKGLKYQIVFAGAIFFQLAGGYPLHVFYSVLVAVLLNIFVFRQTFQDRSTTVHWVKNWAVAMGITLALTAVLWMPFLPTLDQSTRSIQSINQAAAGSLKPDELSKLVVPTLFDNPAQGYKWGPSWSRPPNVSLYFGWFSIFLVVWWLVKAKKTKLDAFLLVASLVAVLLAFGDLLPGYSVIRHLPIIGSARGVSTILMIPTLLLALWVGMIFERLEKNQITKRLFSIALSTLGLLLLFALGSYAIFDTQFNLIWQQFDARIGHALSQSVFHTVERDQVIALALMSSLVVVSGLALLTIALCKKRWFGLVVLLVAVDLAFFTKAHFLFGSTDLYKISPDAHSVVQLLQSADLTNYRVLTRNYNAPYTDFGAYADALTVRSPFSDSYVDEKELREFTHAQRMRDGLTPDWNEAAGVPIIHGYTTLLPTDMHAVFSLGQDVDPSINDLPEIKTSNPELKRWATKYYIVDKWFPTYGEVFPDKVIAQDDRWVVYEIPGALNRFRFENDQSVQLLSHTENPNRIALTFANDTEQSSLIVADRYDKDWQAVVNGRAVVIENLGGLRKIPIQSGQNEVIMTYVPRAFYLGLVISLVTLGCLLLGLVWQKRRRR